MGVLGGGGGASERRGESSLIRGMGWGTFKRDDRCRGTLGKKSGKTRPRAEGDPINLPPGVNHVGGGAR